MGVDRDVLLNAPLLELCKEVPGHAQQQQAVAEGEGGSSPPRDSDPHPHYVPQVRVFGHERVVWCRNVLKSEITYLGSKITYLLAK